MPKNVMKLLKPSPHRARNDFDLSHRHVFSSNFGELLPATCIETVPGDHIVMHASDLLRAIPMVTSPFLRAKQHLDVWFVPYRDLWHQFDAFITKKSEPVSSAMQGADYCPYLNLYELWSAVSSGISAVDVVGQPYQRGAMKLLNLLGYGLNGVGSQASDAPSVNPFRLLAYNYIWYNEYRQQYYDQGTYLFNTGYTDNVASLFNVDILSCDSLANANIANVYNVSGGIGVAALCQMRYRTWKKDLFTGLLPSTQFGNVSALGIEVDAVKDRPATNAKGFLRGSSTSNALSYTDTSATNQGNVVLTSAYDVLALRRSEAVQIWRENALRAGNHIKDNMLAHYGVASDFQDHRPKYLGSVDAPLNIGDVMATANSSYSGNTNPNVNVGDTAGKALSSLDEKVFTYDAKEFGVIMVMHSLLPEAEYNATGISRPNQLLEAEDFFTPEFENLGLEAVSSQNFQLVTNNTAKVIGYAPRYYAYKTKLDKCYGPLMTGYMYAPWCSPKYDVTQLLGSPNYSLPLEVLYVNPKIFDVNFNVSVNNADQFLCDLYFDVDAVRPMSVVGLPFS